MLITHLKLAIRSIRRQPVYTLLNVVGLATGLTAGIVIALYLRDELSYDKTFAGHESIFRVHFAERAESSPLMAIYLQEAMPQIEQTARLSFFGRRVIRGDQESLTEGLGMFADPSVLDIFSFRALEGDPRTALATANAVVITKSFKEKLFGDAPAWGKVLHLDNRRELVVGGVIDDLPARTHMKFDFLVNMPDFYSNTDKRYTENRLWSAMYTYIKLRRPQDVLAVRGQIPQFAASFFDGLPEKKYFVENEGLLVTSLTDIHLRSNLAQEMQPNGSLLTVYVFAAIEILILLTACANFVSLFTTQAIRRMKEVGMKKILGARKRQLIMQFFTEAGILLISAVVLALIFYQSFLPLYNSLSGSQLGLRDLFAPDALITMTAMIVFVGIAAGLYPAFFISRFRSVSFLRESRLPHALPGRVRSALVVFQFVVSTFLIASTIFGYAQMQLIAAKDLGFTPDQVVNVQLNGYLWYRAVEDHEALREELMQDPGIVSVGLTSSVIGDDLGVEPAVPEGKREEDYPVVRMTGVNAGFAPTMRLEIIEGRNFSAQYNDSSSVMLNESAVQALQLRDPIGQVLVNSFRKQRYVVIGVVKNFHFASLHHAVEPLVMLHAPQWAEYLSIRMKGENAETTLRSLEGRMKTLAPNSLFSYEFLDNRIEQMYRTEHQTLVVFGLFAILAILIACLGLLSLCAFACESRTKEIGIRKVLGADVRSILGLLTGGFFKLVLVSMCIGIPLAWYVLDRWLNNFAYRIPLNVSGFLLAAMSVIILAAITMLYHACSAARQNAARSLRYE